MEITFSAPLWIWPTDKASWYFVCLTPDAAEQVRFAMQGQARRGFGSVKVEVRLVDQVWRTSLFPDKARSSYLLPIKAQVRKACDLKLDENVFITLRLVEV